MDGGGGITGGSGGPVHSDIASCVAAINTLKVEVCIKSLSCSKTYHHQAHFMKMIFKACSRKHPPKPPRNISKLVSVAAHSNVNLDNRAPEFLLTV